MAKNLERVRVEMISISKLSSNHLNMYDILVKGLIRILIIYQSRRATFKLNPIGISLNISLCISVLYLENLISPSLCQVLVSIFSWLQGYEDRGHRFLCRLLSNQYHMTNLKGGSARHKQLEYSYYL